MSQDLEYRLRTTADTSGAAATAASIKEVNLETQKQILYATQLEALQAAAAGDASGAERLGREAAMMKEQLSIQRAQNLSQAEALELAEANIAAKEKILALDAADEEVTGRFGRGGRVGTLLSGLGLGELGMAIGFALIAGEALKRMIEGSEKGITKATEEQQKFNAEIEKGKEAFDHVKTVEQWEKESQKIHEQIELLQQKRDLATNDTERDTLDSQISQLATLEEYGQRAGKAALDRADAEEKAKQTMEAQATSLAQQVAAYTEITNQQKAALDFKKQMLDLDKDSAIAAVDEKQRTGEISNKEAAEQKGKIERDNLTAKFDAEQTQRQQERDNLQSALDVAENNAQEAKATAEDLKKAATEAEAKANAARAYQDGNIAQARNALEAATAERKGGEEQIRGMRETPGAVVPQDVLDQQAARAQKEQAAQDQLAKVEAARQGSIKQAADNAEAVAKASALQADLAKKAAAAEAEIQKKAGERIPELDREMKEKAALQAKQLANLDQKTGFAEARGAETDDKRALEEQIKSLNAQLSALEKERQKSGEAARSRAPRGKGEQAGKNAEAAFYGELEEMEIRIKNLEEKRDTAGRKETPGEKADFDAQRDAIRAKYAAPQKAGPSASDIAGETERAAADSAILKDKLGDLGERFRQNPQDSGVMHALEEFLKFAYSTAGALDKNKAEFARVSKEVETLKEHMKNVHSP